MGCTQSKIDMEEAVVRCKERKHLMRQAVTARHAFAAAHFAYAIALKNTGAALSDYAHGEAPDLRPSTAGPSSSSGAAAAAVTVSVSIQPPVEILHPPPPPLMFSALQRSASMPDMPIPISKKKLPADADPIREEDDEEESSRPDEDADATPAVSPPPPQPKPTPVSTPPPPMPDPKSMESWDYFFGAADTMPPPTLSEPNECWAQSRDLEHDNINRTPIPSIPTPTSDDTTSHEERPPAMLRRAVADTPPTKLVKKPIQGGSVHHQHAASMGSSEPKKGKIPTAKFAANLLQIMSQLDDHFLNASHSAHDVSKMLEATRMHYHSNFAGSRGHIDHSTRIMQAITWNQSVKGSAQQDDVNDDFEDEAWETHATILDKMLAWEKKLYDEVKAGELMKIEYQRKVTLLDKQKKRGAKPETLEKTKSAVSHLHTRYIVDMQSMDSTVSEINRLRDHQLYPKLVELVDGMAKMWWAMYEHHSSQLKITTSIRSFEISLVLRETSDEHNKQTCELRDIVREWHLQFQKLMGHQKEYVKALSSWLKLNLIPIEGNLKEKVSSPPRQQEPPIKGLLLAWNDHLEKFPVELAWSAINSFAEVINNITLLQAEELETKRKCDDCRRELERRRRQFNDWHRKYIEKRASLSEEATEGGGGEAANHDPVMERKIAVEAVEIRLKEEEENHRMLCKQVRDKSLGSLRTHLPELFRAVSDFAHAASEMYRHLCSITQMKNQEID